MENKKNKVLLFLFGGIGGAERMTINIGKLLPKNQYAVSFVVCGPINEIIDLIPSDYRVIRLDWSNIHMFSRTRISLVIAREKPDFVFSSTMALNIRLLQVSKIMDVKCIVRNDNMLDFACRSLINGMRKWYGWAYWIISQQMEMREQLVTRLGLSPEKVVVLHNIIDADMIAQKMEGQSSPYPDNGKTHYVCVNHFSERKAQDIAVMAFAKVHSKNPESELYFVGKAPENNVMVRKVMSIVNYYNLSESVHIVGFDDNPYRWEKFADCFVSTSIMEGLPNVLIEAQYLGTPSVVTQSIPIIGRIIDNGNNGYSVPVNDVEAVANAMLLAPSLGRIKMTYQPASKQDFISLFI